MYGSIRRAAYALSPDAEPWTDDYRALPRPDVWHDGPLQLCNYGREESQHLKSAPTRRFDGILQTLAPDLIVRPRPGHGALNGETPGGHWLYAPWDVPDPLPGTVLSQLLNAWLRTLGPKDAAKDPGFRALMMRVSEELKEAAPTWEHVADLDLLGAGLPPGRGGTAAPRPWQFQLATDALARRILALEPYEFEGGSLRFRAVPRGPREQGAELMSQPLSRDIKRKQWWFSITLNVSLHTVPFDPRPRLHLHWGVRRWATHPRSDTGALNLPYGRATSVYLQPKIPWLPGAPASDRFARARLVRDRRRETFDWMHNDPAGMLRHLSLQGHFPSPEALLTSPLDWMGERLGVRALVVHSTRMGTHEVGPGLMPHQRSELTEWAEEALPSGVVRVPDLVRRGTGIAAPANRRAKPSGDAAKKAEQLRAAAARRTALATASRLDRGTAGPVTPVVEARLLWQTAELRHAAVTAFAEVLGLDGDGGMSDVSDREFDDARPGTPVLLEWRTDELTLRLRCLPLSGGLSDRLVLDPSVAGQGARLADAIGERRRALRAWLADDGADTGRPELALVEIAHPTAFRPAGTDPKFAVRLGCADAGVLTQFAVTPSGDRRIQNADNLGHRAHNAWLDGLRQLGVRVLPEHTLGGDLPDHLRYAALWMVKRRKDGPTRLPAHLPVAVLVTPLPGASGLARVEGWDSSTRTWIPYPAFLLRLVKEAEIDATVGAAEPRPTDRRPGSVTSRPWQADLEQQRRETSGFLQRMLHSLRGHPTVLITHAQNSRLHWPWLQDGLVQRDLLKDGHAPERRLDDELRLVRVRGRAGRETAQWWGVAHAGKPNGQPAGFWSLPPGDDGLLPAEERVFYSTTDRPRTHAISPSLDRLTTRVNAAGRLTSQAGTAAWNPALVEIAVLGCHPEGDAGGHRDRPEAIAMAMHQLRQAPDYPDALSLPLPLHLAGLAQAYVLPTFTEEVDEEDDTATAGEEAERDVSAAEQDGSTAREDPASDLDPDLAEAAGLAGAPEPAEQLPLF
ncbi:pPIWI_RE module domain-containing protein [Streptomyces caatingaensis]|uniref:DUF3893 domain-containing protein n=1 Tax=Streptomyces caatingaensis TaxID=1678637 RepID=A0A0K9XLS1_9ACTN|nr:DUF3962 domain-containing protein [Streptomyces caatingaensis]KNB53627.1 hypothetical protein AC230_03090 [Streptomyces caatingaensis]